MALKMVEKVNRKKEEKIMKKTALISMAILALASCTAKMEKLADVNGAEGLAQQIQINIADFVSADDPATKATVTTAGVFAWSTTDVIGIWPETVDAQQVAGQLPFTYNSGSGSSVVFRGSGWGLICDGGYTYDAYFPYNGETVDSEHIPFTYPANIIGTHNNINRVYSYLYMYGPAITPASTAEATFNFYQLSALAKFAITAPQGVQYTKVVIKTADASNVFTTAGTYDLTTASKGSVTITPTTQTNALGFSCDETLSAEKPTMNFWIPMCPAALNEKTLNISVWDSSNNKYVGTKVCTKNQVSGKYYTYSVTVVADPDPVNPYASAFVSTIEPVDLGHSKYLFAPMNLGATSIEETGDFFAWGETETKAQFDNSTYTGRQNPLVDGLLAPEDDAAHVKWGGDWIMPNYLESNEFLQNQCDKEWVTINGTQGWKCYNKKDHSKWIFLPAGGRKVGTEVLDSDQGFYWTSYSSGGTYFSHLVNRYSPTSFGDTRLRTTGLSIRPVQLK